MSHNVPDDALNFLENNILQTGADNIRIIEWRPSLNFYKDSYVKLLSQAVAFIKRRSAEERTTAFFGRRWVKNFFKNTSNLKNCLLYKETSVPVIITGSAPSLEQAVPIIKKMQEFFLIIAASSSLASLSYYGIRPDFIVTTDGGGWALLHLHQIFRSLLLRETSSLAVNLCAALPSQCAGDKKLIINDGSLWQSIILHELNIPSVVIPQRGTVTATALDLALILSRGSIFTAGMDFTFSDIITHVKPYNFDVLLLEKAARVSPLYSNIFTRAFLMRQSGSMDIYAEWFKQQLSLLPKRIFSIGSKNNIFVDGGGLLNDYLNKNPDKKNLNDNYKTFCINENSENLCKRGLNSLLSALKDKNYAGKLKQELASLLFPGEKTVTDNELETALKNISRNANKQASHEN